MNIVQAFRDPAIFGSAIPAGSWSAWQAFLGALFGLDLDVDGQDLFRQCTGRTLAPRKPFSEAVLICGRRAGKSFILAIIAVFLACFRNYRQYLAPGERATIMILAADRRQARTIFRYIKGILDSVPILRQLVDHETAEGIHLTTFVTIEVTTASHRVTRGYTLAGALLDELAFWGGEESAKPDFEVINALRPGMATIPGSMLLCASSPYARKGVLFEAWKQHYGRDDSNVFVWRAPSRTMNPGLPQSIIDAAMEADPEAAASEYLAEWRNGISAFVPREAVEACVSLGVRERPPVTGIKYSAHVDPSGGQADSYAMAIAHREKDMAVLDLVREIRPPFSPENVTAEFGADLKRYGIKKVTGDRYAGEFPRELFRKVGITYTLADKPASQIFQESLPAISSKTVDLLDHPRLISQLCALERRTGRAGRDSIGHGPGGHDDLAVVACGALLSAVATPRQLPRAVIGHYVMQKYADSGRESNASRYPPEVLAARGIFHPNDRQYWIDKGVYTPPVKQDSQQ